MTAVTDFHHPLIAMLFLGFQVAIGLGNRYEIDRLIVFQGNSGNKTAKQAKIPHVLTHHHAALFLVLYGQQFPQPIFGNNCCIVAVSVVVCKGNYQYLKLPDGHGQLFAGTVDG